MQHPRTSLNYLELIGVQRGTVAFNLLPYSTSSPTPPVQWASKAGLITTRNEFGDIYGLDDEVIIPTPTFIVGLLISSWLRAVVEYGPSTGYGCGSTFPPHRRLQEEARCSVR